MFHQRQFQSAMLIPPECACNASSTSELPSLDYGDSNRNRTASLPSIAMTQGHTLMLCSDETQLNSRTGYVPTTVPQCCSETNIGTNSLNRVSDFEQTVPAHPDSMPILPCSRPTMVRPGYNIRGGGSNPELGNTSSYTHPNLHTNTSTLTNSPTEPRVHLQRQCNSLLGVDFSSSSSSPVGGSLSQLDAYNPRRHRRKVSTENNLNSLENNSNIHPKTYFSDLNKNDIVEVENPFWPEQSLYCVKDANDGEAINVANIEPSDEFVNSTNMNTCNNANNNHYVDNSEEGTSARHWLNVEFNPSDYKDNPFPMSVSSSESTGSHYDNYPVPYPCSNYLQPPNQNPVFQTETWPHNSHPGQREGQMIPPSYENPCVKIQNDGESQTFEEKEKKDFTIVHIDSDNDESAAENASLIPTPNQPCQSAISQATYVSSNALNINNENDESHTVDKPRNRNSPRGSFSEKQKRNRKFRRKNSSNLIISQTGHHRNNFGKAAKRLCIWKQKLAGSRQNISKKTPSSTTKENIPMQSISSTPNPTKIQSSFNVKNSTYSSSKFSPYHTDNESESIRSILKKSKNTTKQKSSKPNSTSNSSLLSAPTIVLSAPPPDEDRAGGDPRHSTDIDTQTVDSDTLHSLDYDTIEGFPSSTRNMYLQNRLDINPTPYGRGVGNGPGSSSSTGRPFRLRRNSRRLACNGHKAEFTVVPVKNETNLREQERVKRHDDSSLRVPVSGFEIDGEPTDTLTQNSITSLLSAKFRDVAKRWKQYGVESPRFRKRIHSKWESMNYDSIDSKLSRELEHDTSKRKLAMQWLLQWFIYFLIGIGTALLAAGVQISVEIIAHEKFDLIREYLDKCSKEGCSLVIPVMIWVGMNAGITLLGAALVTFVQPMAAGSGIPLIKSYLNGVRVPGLLSLRAFIAKCVGVILSILGGLACGKEGPMAHSGGIMGAGFGKGRIPWFGKDISLYGMFRNDHNIRDLVAAGAASGVSAAFGAPVGGTLFSVEEAASFWNTELVWKVFFSAMIACFSTNFLLSAFEGHPTQLSNPGLVRFNTFPNLTFDLIEIPVFILLAVIGGLTGSLFVVMNYKLTVFRQKYLHRRKWIKVVEAAVVAVTSAIVAFLLMYTVNDCTEATPRSHHAILTKMGCEGNSHNSMSTLFLTTPEGCLKSLLHDPLDTYSVLTLVLFIVIFFLLGVWTYGLSVSSGVFIPSLAIGAAWGRLIGMGVVELFPDQAKDVGKYALIGAASQLGGILRTTISLTVIIVECTGDITFGLCIMISLMISKWVGDFFTTGLYDMNVEVSGIPLLSWEPPPLCDHVKVSDFMSQPVMSMLQVEKVGHVMECLKGETFHGFPIIEQDPAYDLMYKGKLKGLILRSQLLVLMRNKAFCPEGEKPRKIIDLSDFDNPYPVSQRLSVEDIELTEEEKNYVIDLGPYMSQTPYIVSPNFSMPRTFRLFRGLGLRHLIIINDEFEPVGMVTRKDLAKYRAGIKKGMLHMEQLTVENR